MKYYLFIVFTTMVLGVNAQLDLVANQNPNYLSSQQYYVQKADSLESTMNTTVQDTYKAYDFYENKLERKQNRIKNRHQVRLARAYNPNYYFDRFYYNNWCWNNPRGFNTFGGYRLGNWWWRW